MTYFHFNKPKFSLKLQDANSNGTVNHSQSDVIGKFGANGSSSSRPPSVIG